MSTGAIEDPTPAADPSPEGKPPAAVRGGVAISKRRLVLIDVLVAFTTLLAIVGMLSIYANRLLFNPDNWEAQSSQLLQDPTIRSQTAGYLVDQIYANVDVAGLIKSGLPPQLQPLAGPAAGALQSPMTQGIELLLERPRVQTLWAKANRAADQAFITIVNGGKGPVGINEGAVTLNLGAIVDTVAARLGLPSGLSSKLPANIATLTVFKSDQLKAVQDIGKLIKGLALWLTIIVPLLWILAIALARGHRRRTFMTIGFSIVLAGIAGYAIRHVLESQVTTALTSDAGLQSAIRAALGIGTSLLGEIAGAFILVGAVFVVTAWFAGPSRISTPARRALAPSLRENPPAAFGVTTALMILVFIWDPIPATGTPVGIVVFLALALFGTEMLRRQTAVEFPDAMPGDAAAAMRARWESLRARRSQSSHGSQSPAAASIPDQLERLAAMRDGGTITADDYESAKTAVLQTAKPASVSS